MKKILFLLAIAVTTLTGCGKEDEGKTEQEVWLSGYHRQFAISDDEIDQILFLFFKSADVKEFVPITKKSNVDSHYGYTKLEEDPIYTNLINNKELLLPSGKTIKPVEYFLTAFKSDQPMETATLPLGDYFVVALQSVPNRMYYWNKYACCTFTVYDRYNPLYLSVTIPGDITQYGCIPWLNKGDKSYNF